MTLDSISTLHLPRQVARFADQVFEREVGALNVTRNQVVLLHHIEAMRRPTQTDLVNATLIDRSTMSEMLRRLERSGLVSRMRSASDERTWRVALTTEGSKVLLKARAAAVRAEMAFFEHLAPSRRKAFVSTMKRFADASEASSS
jgi:DNA-binding MarR family transcriptional regulator